MSKRNTRRSTFKPSAFEEVPEIKTKKVIFKGNNDYYMDLTEVEKCIQYLRKHHDKQYQTLRGQVKKNFDYITRNVAMLQDSDYYGDFINLINKYFDDLDHPYPGTVGGYMCNCLGGKYSSCTPMCAGVGDSDCSYAVVQGTYNKRTKRFRFDYLSDNDKHSDKAYVYVDYDNINKFPGFCEADRKRLRDMKIKSACVYGEGYEDDYAEFTSGFVDIDSIKNVVSYEGGIKNSGIDGSMIVVIFIFLILLFALIAVAMGKNKSH